MQHDLICVHQGRRSTPLDCQECDDSSSPMVLMLPRCVLAGISSSTSGMKIDALSDLITDLPGQAVTGSRLK
jgi:hypothetical protein